VRIIGVGHYDPYLGLYDHDPRRQAFATQSVDVIARLNAAMRSVYAAAGIPMADVAAAFDMTSTDPVFVPGIGDLPRNVAQTCVLTWMCAPRPLGPNKHPNDAGYRVISDAISDVVPPASSAS
jgi:hypothetical protein